MSGARTDEAASDSINSVVFSFYGDDEIRRTSVKRITKANMFDTKNSVVPDGLYDPAMGPLNETDLCKSCGQLFARCPGHVGHIELAKPLYNPLQFQSLRNFLQITCFYCHKFRLKEKKIKIYASQLDLIARGDVVGSRALEDSWSGVHFSEEDEMEITADGSGGSFSDLSNIKPQTWTSLQHSAALSVLSKLMRKKHRKCNNCDRKNPTISCPTFGWLNKTTHAANIRSNVIKEFDLGSNMEVPQSNNDNASEIDEESPLSINSSKKTKRKMIRLSDDLVEKMLSAGKKHLLPSEAETILKGLWKNEARLCMLICDFQQRSVSISKRKRGYQMFFLRTLLVPPNKFRPPSDNASRGVLEHPQNVLLSKVQESNIALQNLIATAPDHPDIVRRWMDLQRSVNILFDSSKGIVKTDKEVSGIRQLLERKTGILRQKMMGKRVNFACRSVISPDPYLSVNEIGIPPYFALKLTYPERVTPWNAKTMRCAIINGADIHPGATLYKDKDNTYNLHTGTNRRYAISKKLLANREVVARQGKGPESDFEGKVVYRHLRDGDIVLVNRQPTLHKPSMMAHVVRVLKGEKTIRMHYANCSTYNADFDGDEMNVHLPQDEISRAEAVNIVNANKQYIVPTSGNPIRGLIQDHIVSAVLLTKLDTFLNRNEYHQLLCASVLLASSTSSQISGLQQKVSLIDCNDEIDPLLPAILKPKPLWTGKQVITAILNYVTKGSQPLTVEQKGRIPKGYLQGRTPRGSTQIDAWGQKDTDPAEFSLYIHDNELIKGMIDKAQFGKHGLVHTVHEFYGAETAGNLLSIFSRLFTSFLQMHGFTCGVDDLLLSPDSDMQRMTQLGSSENKSYDIHKRFIATEDRDIDPLELQSEVEKVIRGGGDTATINLDRLMIGAMNDMTSEVNKLFPNGLQKPFPRNCLSLMTSTGAKGGLVNMNQISSLLGQQELEGKRVPRMVSGKTLPCFAPWDTSSRAGGFVSDRFLTGLRPQEYYFHCMAGRDGLVDTAVKTSRSGYLQRCLVKNLECLKVSYDHTVRDADGSVVQFKYGEDGIDVLKTSFLDKPNVLTDNRKVILDRCGNDLNDVQLSKSNDFIELPYELRQIASAFVRLPKEQQGCHHEIKRKDLMKLLKVKYLSSLAEPGEPVGIIAAQSIGEPSTQMTLNTFHLAGRGEMNVTLGIPRLQEILMTASANIRTPIMKCPMFVGTEEKDAQRVAASLRRILVADIIESMEVCSVPFSVNRNQVSTIYKLKLKLYPLEVYPSYLDLTLEECHSVLSTNFVEAMEDAIQKHLDLMQRIRDIKEVSRKEGGNLMSEVDDDAPSKPTKVDNDDDGGDDSDVDAEDQGADVEKRKRQARDEVEYDDDIEKERSTMADEQDGEHQSGPESELDQAEAEEDYTVGGEVPLEIDEEAFDSPLKDKTAPVLDVGKHEVTEDKNKKIEMKDKKNAEKPKKRRKRPDRTIFVKSKDLEFEVHYIFRKEPHVLLAEIVQKTAKSIYVRESKNIEHCSVLNNNQKEPPILQTSGVNFKALWELSDDLDINKIVSNDIHAMLNAYGVEAARATIIQEVNAVFKAYGIQVNIRHLSLVADFMTFHGGYRPMNRMGVGEFSTSPFGKMTFETAMKFIVSSAFHGEVDMLEAPSASVSLGQPVKMGTGCFDLLQKLDFKLDE